MGRNSILEPSPFPTGEMFLDKPIPSDAIIHLFIPRAIREIAESIFSTYPMTFVSESTQSLWISIPDKIQVNQELLEEPKFLKYRFAEIEIPDYQTFISNFVHNHFQNSETLKKPLVFHVTRLTTEWLTH